MEEPISGIAEAIITFQKKASITDSQMAFESHLTVERLHDIKAMETTPTDVELKDLKDFMAKK